MRTSGHLPPLGAFLVVGLALGLGLATGGPVRGSDGRLPDAPVVEAALDPSQDPSQGPVLPRDPDPATLPAREVAIEVSADLASPGPLPVYSPLGLPCGASLTATPAPGATVDLRLSAPCHGGAAVTLRHGPLAASYRASGAGVVEARFPAFSAHAEFAAELPDGQILSAEALVPGAAGYERMVTMWSATGRGLSVHAFEFGAAPGAAGHVWHGAPRQPIVAEGGGGGYLLELGTPGVAEGRLAEVYSFPAAGARRQGAVRLALSAEVTPDTCSLPIDVVTLQIGEGLPGEPVAVTLPGPGCGAGQPPDLVLKYLARDLKIAGTD